MSSNKQGMTVHIPADACDELNIKQDTEMVMIVKNGRIVIQPRRSERINSRLGFLIWPLIIAAVTAIGTYLYWLYIDLKQVPLAGNVSLSSFIIGVGVVTGTVLFAGYFIHSRNDGSSRFSKHIYWRNLPVILISFAVILATALIGFMWLMGSMLPGATFDRLTAILIFALFTFAANTFMVIAALTIDATTLAQLMTLVIVIGVLIAMAANGSRRWWQHNLSFLGTNMANNGWQFNLTLIIASFIMLALTDYLFVSLRERFPQNRRLLILRILLTIVALDVACIGLFPNNAASHFLHDQAAAVLVFMLVALIASVRWLLPGVSQLFLYASYGVAVLLLMLNFGFRWFRYPSLTSFEIQAFVLAFGWLLLLFNRLQDLVAQGTVAWLVTVKPRKSNQ